MPQPTTNRPAGAEGAWNEALIEQAWEAFQREAPLLIPEHAGEWVAYHGEKRVGFARTRAEVWQACLDKGLPEGEFWVFNVQPILGDEVIGSCG
jgi:Family of unknown function (DUF5678)